MMKQLRHLLAYILVFPFVSSTNVFSQGVSKSFRQQSLSKWKVKPGNYSGIAKMDGNLYAVVSDKECNDGFYVFMIDIDSVNGKLTDADAILFPCHVPEKQSSSSASTDAEGIAYVPSLRTLFISDEGSQRIREYGANGHPTGRELLVPQCFSVDSIYSNYGFESLTYSRKDSLLWATTEHTLKADGRKSSYRNIVQSCLRLVSFNPVTLKPVSELKYKTEKPTVRYKGRNYAFGVVALAALDDGRLLVLEREFHVSSRYLNSWVKHRIYAISPDETDKEGSCVKHLVFSFKTNLNVLRHNLANFEGMCLGPRLKDGRQTVILVSDSQANAGNKLFRMKDCIKILVLKDY